MQEKESDGLIGAIKEPVDDHVAHVARKALFGDKEQFKFANDNQGTWPFIPFPEDWYAGP